MKILIISNQNPFKVSGIIALYLYQGFKDKNHDTKLLIKDYVKHDNKEIIALETLSGELIRRIYNKIKKFRNKATKLINRKIKRDPNYYMLDLDETVEYFKTEAIIKKINFQPDVIIYLFPVKFLNAKNLYELNQITGAPIYWYMPDMVPFTGGCHYAWDCNGYKNICGNCPGIYSNDANDITFKNLKFKEKYFEKTNLKIVAGSEFAYNQAKSSTLFKNKSISKILGSVDHDIFAHVAKTEGKKKYNIPNNKKVIFFGATTIIEKRKGMKYLVDSLNILKQNNKIPYDILLLVAGNNFDKLENLLPFETRYLGLLENNEQLASAFQAADVFVCPSIEDSGPMMINDAIMCGTPVVSFEMGVAFDLIINGKTGYMAKLYDSNALAEGIEKILNLDPVEYDSMTENCRRLAIEEFSVNSQTSKFINLFENI